MLDTLSREMLATPLDGGAAGYDAMRLVALPSFAPRPSTAPTSAVGQHRSSLRITRRGRLAVVVTVALLLLVAFSVGRVMSSAASSAPAQAPTHTVVVAPGDTAWSISRAAMPSLDGRDAVDRLLALNHSDGRLVVGQTLVVPGS